MKRREALIVLATATAAAAAGALLKAAGRTPAAARRLARVPPDILARLRRRTQPVTARTIGPGDHLAG